MNIQKHHGHFPGEMTLELSGSFSVSSYSLWIISAKAETYYTLIDIIIHQVFLCPPVPSISVAVQKYPISIIFTFNVLRPSQFNRRVDRLFQPQSHLFIIITQP